MIASPTSSEVNRRQFPIRKDQDYTRTLSERDASENSVGVQSNPCTYDHRGTLILEEGECGHG